LEHNEQIECGAYELKKFIAHHLEYPEIAVDRKYEGKVWVKYILTTEGSLDAFLDKGNQVDPSLEKAAMQVMQELKDSIESGVFKVIPGKSDGKLVQSFYKMPFSFILPKEENAKGKREKKIVIATYRTSEETVQFRRDLEGNIYAYSLLPKEEKMLIKIDGNKDPVMLTEEEQSYFFLYNLTFLKSKILLTLGKIDGKEYEVFIDKNGEEEAISFENSDMHIKVYSSENHTSPIEIFSDVDQLFSSKYAVLLFR
jgi:hypothetical protein